MSDVENPGAEKIGRMGVSESAETAALVRDGLALLTAFRSIADENLRRSLVTLATALAKSA